MNTKNILLLAEAHPDIPPDFVVWLERNLVIWAAFEQEALKMVSLGFTHYSARTIVHFMRHHTALAEGESAEFKINNDHSPYLARLFAAAHPEHSDLFSYRVVGKEAA